MTSYKAAANFSSIISSKPCKGWKGNVCLRRFRDHADYVQHVVSLDNWERIRYVPKFNSSYTNTTLPHVR